MCRLRGEVASAWLSGVRAPLGLAGMAVILAGCAGSPAGETAALKSGPDPMGGLVRYVERPFLVASQRMRSDEADAIVARAITEHEMRRP